MLMCEINKQCSISARNSWAPALCLPTRAASTAARGGACVLRVAKPSPPRASTTLTRGGRAACFELFQDVFDFKCIFFCVLLVVFSYDEIKLNPGVSSCCRSGWTFKSQHDSHQRWAVAAFFEPFQPIVDCFSMFLGYFWLFQDVFRLFLTVSGCF